MSTSNAALHAFDTNICIHVIKNRPAGLRERFNGLADQLCISAITLAEIIYGAEKSSRPVENLTGAEQFAARVDILPFAERASAHYGQIRAELDRAGTPVGAYDMMIGAHARSEGLTVVTNNLREFQRMKGLRVENWI